MDAAAQSDTALAVSLAERAGEALVALRLHREPGERLGKDGDRLAQGILAEALGSLRPDDAVLSEEGDDDARRATAGRVWIVDPLDGTREYSHRTPAGWREDWAVHVALWTRESGLTAGAVAIPARGVVYDSDRARTDLRPSVRRPGPLRLAVSRSHPAPVVGFLTQRLDLELIPMGSAGVKAMAVVSGEVDAYVHDGGQYEWDSAAPVAVARAAGLVTHRIDGTALEYNRPSPWLPDLFVSSPEAADELEGVLGGYRP